MRTLPRTRLQSRLLVSVALISAVALSAVALSGCAVIGRPPAGSTVSPRPDAPRPALTELVLEPGGLGELRIGLPVPDAEEGTSTVRFDPDFCGGELPGLWVADYPAITDGPASQPDAFRVETEGRDGANGSAGGITMIGVSSPRIATAEGVHIGSTLDDLLAAYPDAFAETTAGVGASGGYALDGEGGRLVFGIGADLLIDGIWAVAPNQAVFDGTVAGPLPGCS